MVKKVVLVHNEEGKVIDVLDITTIQDNNTFLSLVKEAKQNKENDIAKKQLELDTKEQKLNKVLKEFETRLILLELEQKLNRGELTQEEYDKEIAKYEL